MVLSKKHLCEVTDSKSIEETLICGSQHLHSILTCAKTLDTAIELSSHQALAEVLINMEQHNLSITTSNADFVMSYSLNAFDTHCANRLTENKHLVLDLERAELS
jgi:hypothetical protein